MITDKYSQLLEHFRRYYPGVYKDAIDWWVSGPLMVTVKLNTGETFEYNHYDNSLRRLPSHGEYIEDEAVRRKAFGHNLQKMIPLSGMSQQEVAAKLGITNAMLSRYIHGTTMPSADKAYLLARVLDCRVDDLFDTQN